MDANPVNTKAWKKKYLLFSPMIAQCPFGDGESAGGGNGSGVGELLGLAATAHWAVTVMPASAAVLVSKEPGVRLTHPASACVTNREQSV